MLWGKRRRRTGEFGLQVMLEMSPLPFFAAFSCCLDHQFLLRSSVTSCGPLSPRPRVWDQQMVRVEDEEAEAGSGTAEAGMEWRMSV